MGEKRKRRLFVGIYRLFVFIVLCGIFVVGFGQRYEQLLIISRTGAVVISTFVFVSFFMTKIYGKLEIGEKKNKPIFYSFILNTFITDIFAFLALQVMTYSLSNTLLKDTGYLLLIFITQIIVIYILIVIGNALYFINYIPSRTVIINNNSNYLNKITKFLKRHTKQYKLVDILNNPDLSEIAVDKYDKYILLNMNQEFLLRLISKCYFLEKEIMANYSYMHI